jgi:hypothetical protein
MEWSDLNPFALGERVNNYIDEYTGRHADEDVTQRYRDAQQECRTDRLKKDPYNQDTDRAAAEHYLFARSEGASEADGTPKGAAVGTLKGAGMGILTLGYDAVKEAGYLAKDHGDPVTSSVADYGLKKLVQLTTPGDVPDGTLPSRPTLKSTMAGIEGAAAGIGDAWSSMWAH